MMIFDENNFTLLKDTIKNFIFSLNINDAGGQFIDRNIDAYQVYINENLIVETSEQMVHVLNNRLMRKYVEFKAFGGGGDIALPNEKSGTRTINSSNNGMSEIQPINSSIDVILSPDTKSKNISSGNEKWTEQSPYEIRANLKVKLEHEFANLLRGVIMPMFDFYSKIY